MKPCAVLVHVKDVKVGLDWYMKAFPNSKTVYLENFNHTVLEIDGFLLEIVQADTKVGSGKHGTVLYWFVPQLDIAIKHFEEVGAKLYRGPMVIGNNLGMCQLEDPFGNLIGLRGGYCT